jgi:hypothetical protein
MAKSLILKNITGSNSVTIPDLGIHIPVGETIDFTPLIQKDRFLVYASANLRSRVSANEVEVIYQGSAVPFAQLESFLERLCVLEHDIAADHTGNLPESRISDDGILARLADDEVVTGHWTFPGGITVQTGTTLPATLPAGSIFYNTDTQELFVSNGSSWVEYATLEDILSGHDHDGTNSPKVSHTNLLDIGENDHHNKEHDLNGTDHIGNLSESRIQNEGILARVADDEAITGIYDFTTGGLIVQAGTLANRPVGTIADGRLYWATDTKTLYVGNGLTWDALVSGDDFTAHDHDGTNSPRVDHVDLLNKGTYTHADIDAHIDETVDPHGDEMTVSTRVITPEIKNAGDITVDAASDSDTTVFFKNSGLGSITLRVMGNFQYDGTIDHTTLIESQVNDNSIVLNSNFTAGAPTSDASVKVRRGDEPDAITNWSESDDRWQVGVEGDMYFVARIDADETVTGDWQFDNVLIIPRGAILPAPEEAKIFWKSDTDDLYLSDGTTWIRFIKTGEFEAHNHDGVNSPAVSHNDLDDVTPNQHHNQAHDLNGTDHLGSLDESRIADGAILARVGSNETITGEWTFDNSLRIQRAAGTAGLTPYLGRLLWDTSDSSLKMGDGTAWNTIAKQGGILSASAGNGLSNSGTSENPVFDVNVDNATLQILGDILSVKAIPEALITDGNILARLGSDETITGKWSFDTELVIPVLSGTTPPVAVVEGALIQMDGDDNFYIGANGEWAKIITSQNLSETVRSRIQLSRNGGCNPGTFLQNGEVITSLTQGIPVVANCTLAGAAVLNGLTISDGSGVEIFKNGSAVATIDIASGQNKGYSNTLSVAFVAGDFISVRTKTTNGSNLSNPQVTLEFK